MLFDLDHTLMDSDASEALAFERAMRLIGIEEPQRHMPDYDRINKALWLAVERQEITPADVHIARFEQLIAGAGLVADPLEMGNAFADGMGMFGDLYPGAREMLDAVAGVARLGLVTNGLSDIQRARLERLDIARYFDAIVISGEVGSSKPHAAIFDIAFQQLGMPAKETALMVGDSLSSDIRGGADYGIATCWYNWRGATAGKSDRVDHEIATLDQLGSLIVGS